MQPKRDYQALDRKLGKGMPLEEAAISVGIPLEEAQEYAGKRLRNVDARGYQLVAVASEALRAAMAKLTQVAEEGPRYAETEYNDEGKPIRSRTPHHTDVDAAKALAKIATDTLKLAAGVQIAERAAAGGAKVSVQLDLWDSPGNWTLKKPE
jgi:hypothetical protein